MGFALGGAGVIGGAAGVISPGRVITSRELPTASKTKRGIGRTRG